MKLVWTEPFRDDFLKLPEQLQRRVLGKLEVLKDNWRHPSLRTKKTQGHVRVYEASINMQYRLLFRLQDDTMVLDRVGTHKILNDV